ncbi:MAG: alpha/beta hydrolase [Chloroflexi bacterium]|nr:alpha/beta hydrolase [Chloroflexota bacterium]
MADQPPPAPPGATSWTSWAQSIVNGAVGDYLHARQNGLGIAMAFYHHDRPLPLQREAILQAHPHPTTRLCVLVHGLGCNEDVWTYPDPARPAGETSYGAALQADLGYTPLFVRYNSGLAIAENGRQLATLLADLVEAYPLPVDELILIGHSMGGLVIRYACHDAAQHQAPWVGHVRQVFYLGSPHDGAPLALLSHIAAEVLTAVPNPITRLIGDIFNLRSQGIKDLRAAPLVDAHGHHPAEEPVPQQVVPWLMTAQHYLVVGTLGDDPQHLASILLGDGLVLVPRMPTTPPDGTGPDPILPDQIVCFPRTGHLRLARDPAVYQQIRRWCAGAEGVLDGA